MKYRDLSDQDKTELESALNYMKMEELKKCRKTAPNGYYHGFM